MVVFVLYSTKYRFVKKDKKENWLSNGCQVGKSEQKKSMQKCFSEKLFKSPRNGLKLPYWLSLAVNGCQKSEHVLPVVFEKNILPGGEKEAKKNHWSMLVGKSKVSFSNQ